MSSAKRAALTGVDISTQIPLLQKVGPHWLLWIEYDLNVENGTYLRLMADGQIWKEKISHGKTTTKVVKNKS